MLLEIKNLNVYYGVIQALKDVSFHVDEGEVVALIGANGAGKTTTLHTISGLLKPKSGEIIYKGKNIVTISGNKIVSMGMAHVPEGRRVFADLSVAQNLKMGAYTRRNKKEIEDTIDTMNAAFDKLFDSMFEVTSMDISSDASVMKTLLEQEGLTGHSFGSNTTLPL